MMKLRHSLHLVILLSLISPSLGASDPVVDPLAEGLRPFLEAFGGKQSQFKLSGTFTMGLLCTILATTLYSWAPDTPAACKDTAKVGSES